MTKIEKIVTALTNDAAAAKFICQAKAVVDGQDLLIIALKQPQGHGKKAKKLQIQKEMIPDGIHSVFTAYFKAETKSTSGEINGWFQQEEHVHAPHHKGSAAHLRIENLSTAELEEIVKKIAPTVQARGVNVKAQKAGNDKRQRKCRGKVPTSDMM